MFSLCQADVIASHRALIVECEGVEVSDNGFAKQGSVIAFFVFTDTILVSFSIFFFTLEPVSFQ